MTTITRFLFLSMQWLQDEHMHFSISYFLIQDKCTSQLQCDFSMSLNTFSIYDMQHDIVKSQNFLFSSTRRVHFSMYMTQMCFSMYLKFSIHFSFNLTSTIQRLQDKHTSQWKILTYFNAMSSRRTHFSMITRRVHFSIFDYNKY